MTIKRRRLLQSSAGLLAFSALGSITGCSTLPGRNHLKIDPLRILDLPEGFTYTLLQKKGEMMSDGYQVPGRPDGMGAFAGENGSIILMRNHELDARQSDYSPAFSSRSKKAFYDPEGYGAVTRLVIDPNRLEVVSSNLVLAGSSRNCAGGLSPWGWVSCEETLSEGHGFAFLCRQDADQLASPEKLTDLGRFNHEAFAYNPQTGVSYLTEDRGDGCLYRFVPNNKSQPFSHGKLQAMSVVDKPQFNTSLDMEKGRDYQLSWVDIAEPVPEDDSCRFQGRKAGAAMVSRGEGLWFHNGELYFSATNGGLHGKGQIFQITGLDEPHNQLRLVCEAGSDSALEFPDNIAVAPWGGLVVAEDGSWTDYIRMINRQGKITTLARNARSFKEIAGVCFSPDGNALFLNLQEEGMTLAITGPFEAYANNVTDRPGGVWSRSL